MSFKRDMFTNLKKNVNDIRLVLYIYSSLFLNIFSIINYNELTKVWEKQMN